MLIVQRACVTLPVYPAAPVQNARICLVDHPSNLSAADLPPVNPGRVCTGTPAEKTFVRCVSKNSSQIPTLATAASGSAPPPTGEAGQ